MSKIRQFLGWLWRLIAGPQWRPTTYRCPNCGGEWYSTHTDLPAEDRVCLVCHGICHPVD